MSRVKFLAAATLALSFASVVTIPAAQAKGGHGSGSFASSGKSSHHHHYRYGGPLFVATPDCDYYLARYEDTGNPYWKRRYWACIG